MDLLVARPGAQAVAPAYARAMPMTIAELEEDVDPGKATGEEKSERLESVFSRWPCPISATTWVARPGMAPRHFQLEFLGRLLGLCGRAPGRREPVWEGEPLGLSGSG